MKMNKKYFLTLAMVGICFEFFIAYLVLGRAFISMINIFQNPKFAVGVIISIICGTFTTIYTGRNFSKEIEKIGLFTFFIFAPVSIFISGVFVGSILNFVFNFVFNFESFSFLYKYFWDFFVKPFYWLVIIGVPVCLVLNVLQFSFFKIKQKIIS